MWNFDDMICYSCGSEYQDDNDVSQCPHCDSLDVEILEVAMMEQDY